MALLKERNYSLFLSGYKHLAPTEQKHFIPTEQKHFIPTEQEHLFQRSKNNYSYLSVSSGSTRVARRAGR